MVNYPQSSIVRQIFTKGQPLTFGKNEVVLGNDTEPNGVYFIGSGFMKIYSITDDGDEFLHLILGSGEIFPIIWAYLGLEPESTFYQTISQTTLWRISRDWFMKFVELNLPASAALSTQLAQQFRTYVDRLDNLEYKKAGERLAYRLLYLASRFGVRHDGGILIDAPLTHELIGNSINLARESVSRQMETLVREDIIGHAGRSIVIKDVQALRGKLSKPAGLKNWRHEIAQ